MQPEFSLRNKSDVNQCLLDYCFVRVREAGKLAAMKLLVRLEGWFHVFYYFNMIISWTGIVHIMFLSPAPNIN